MFKILILLCFQFCIITQADSESPFQFLTNFFGSMGTNVTRDVSQMSLKELGISRGECSYYFVDYVSHVDRRKCAKGDNFISHILPSYTMDAAHKSVLTVKCLQTEFTPNTTRNNSLLMMNSVADILELLKPIGNATKRSEYGSCVVVLFHTLSSLGCAHVAPYANMLPYQFPTLRIAAIDAFEFPRFNTEFGIVGLPSLLLFHQGRPIVKFYSEIGTFANFVTKHTGIKAVEIVPSAAEIKGPLPLQPIEQPDYNLVLAWAFIILSALYYFAKTPLCKDLIEFIRNTWNETQEEMERN